MTQDTAITRKTRELCQAILDQPELVAARQSIDKFIADDRAKAQYESLMNRGQALQQKQQTARLTDDEIAAFNKERDALMSNPVARGFLDAQEEMHHVHESIVKFVSKTLELGRMPTDSEMEGGCGDGCGCGHNH